MKRRWGAFKKPPGEINQTSNSREPFFSFSTFTPPPSIFLLPRSDKKRPALICMWFAQQKWVPRRISQRGGKADTRNEILLCCPYFCLQDQTDKILFPPCMKSTLIIIYLLSKYNQEQQINGWRRKSVYSAPYINKESALDDAPLQVTAGDQECKNLMQKEKK